MPIRHLTKSKYNAQTYLLIKTNEDFNDFRLI